jgi:conjugative relaxase-like TrwC/TraI family protein
VSVSWKKLKLGPKQLTAEQIVVYLFDAQAAGDYYSEAGQALTMWHTTARAAVELGIARPGERPSQQDVRRETLAMLISGLNPRTGHRIRKAGPDGTTVAAIDLSMSPAPKSVSVLWALGSNQLRYELETMVAMAADFAVMRMLREQPFVRPHSGEHVRAEDFVAASFMHTTARISGKGKGIPDPQLHLHYLLIGALDRAGQLRALDSKVLADYQAELDAEAQGYLAEMLRERGFEVERTLVERETGRPRVTWEVKGVPRSLIETMSSRTTEIAELKRRFLEEYGREPEGRAWEAWIVKQRGPKGTLTPAELRLEWGQEAAEHGFGPEAVAELVAAADRRRAKGIRERTADGPEARQFRELLLAHVCREQAFIPEAHLDRLAHQLAVGLIPPRVVDDVIADLMGSYDLAVTEGDNMITTLEVLRWEQRSLAATRRLLEAPPAPVVPPALVEAELAGRAAQGQPFDEHQANAVRTAVSGARFVSISGPAGTGKGVASAAITELFRESTINVLHGAHRRVIAVAVPGRTAQQAGVDAGADAAMTLDSLNYRVAFKRLRLSSDDVLLVDEAGMIDHRRYAEFLTAAAAAGATVIQIGDDKQLAPVGPGGLWTSTHRLAEAAGTAAELRVVRRAREAREAEAWTAIREGRVVEGLTMIRDAGRLRLYDTREQMRQGMVGAWWEAGPDRGLMIVDSSNEERDVLNRLAQAKRLEAGELERPAVRLDERRELHVGDRVLFSAIYRPPRREGQPWERRVENGTPAVVRAVDPWRGEVELELDEPANHPPPGQPASPPRVLRVGRDAPVELGYARHVMKAQGVTRDTADIGVSLRTRLNELYTMVSRAREGARVHALAAELEEAAEDQAETKVEAEAAAREAQARARRAAEGRTAGGRYPAEQAAHERFRAAAQLPLALPPHRPEDDLAAELQRAQERREKAEAVTIREIERHAKPSTKEAVGERSLQLAGRARPRREVSSSARREQVPHEAVNRQDRTVGRWSRSPSLDSKAPAQAREATAAAARGEVPPPSPSPRRPAERAPSSLPARNYIEDFGRSYLAQRETVRAFAYYELARHVEYVEDPMARAVERLAADPAASLVVSMEQAERARAELAKRPELADDVEKRNRLVEAERAYQERAQRSESWCRQQHERYKAEGRRERWVEPGVIPRAYVVADEPWASTELTKAVSVAAESHIITRPQRPWMAQQIQGEAERIRQERLQCIEERREQQAEQARHAARMRELQAPRGLQHHAQRSATRQGTPARSPTASPASSGATPSAEGHMPAGGAPRR